MVTGGHIFKPSLRSVKRALHGLGLCSDNGVSSFVSGLTRDEAETGQCAVAGIAHASNIDASRLIDAMAPVGIRKAKASDSIRWDAFALFSTIHQSGYRGIKMTDEIEFLEFPKMPRLSREIIVTEKIDGTNAQIYIGESGEFLTGSRTRWITPEDDNFGFSSWAHEHKNELMQLGPGRHFGEWWDSGIQRRYGLNERRFSLFNVGRWADAEDRPACCHVVPTLYRGDFDTARIEGVLSVLAADGSAASPGFMKPEGIVVFHVAGRVGFKKTIEKDDVPKSLAK